ncbi:hypothetical protein H257_01896 [Aphanomyces astaci]|uniref:Uncharacterized protein n=1 Tax=Aphanomyces astaci TaxID=112090 RepID=W4H5G7_APHAT|nr:hypothetical protein H257_01896 [Aphanomyces astaci]ETV86841.1 hypothetical protein H257_01896 [Aphanomyces astaci]|eukprot:XP_009823640.1 hypothetical protein H257_01896 [Aphanomyces astaci]
MFLCFCGHHASSRALQCRFQRSGETITRHLRAVLEAVRRMSATYIKLPTVGLPVHRRILGNPKFFPFFEHCRMAIDGTHIPVSVPADVVARFQSRKGVTMNVLAACDFDLQFTFVLAGWEGTAGDGKLYEAALRSGLTVPANAYDILDAGFGLTKSCLTPYRGTHYHLKEYGKGSQRPRNKEELFNLRHAQLRNVVERIFGILKKRFPVMSYPVEYDYQFQVDLVMSLCTLHNFIRLQNVQDDFERQADADLQAQIEQPLLPEDQNVWSWKGKKRNVGATTLPGACGTSTWQH